MPLKAVTFDLWETLIADSPSQNDQRTNYRVEETAKLLRDFGIGLKPSELERAHADIWEECSRSWEQAVDLPFGHQVLRFLELARPGLSTALPGDALERIKDIYSTAALLYPPSLIPGALHTISELRSRGLRVGLICNTGRTPGFALRKLLSGFGLLPLLDTALFSDETIVRKPDSRIFRLALEELGTKPGATAHIGDSLKNDVLGALEAGMRAVWISRVSPSGTPPAPAAPSVAEIMDILAGM